MERILLYGGGGHAKVVIDCLHDAGADVIGIFDDTKTGELLGVPYLGVYDPALEPDAGIVVTIGDNEVRKLIADTSRHLFANAIHSSAMVSRFASIGTGNMILHRAMVQASSVIGNHVIINTGAQVDHDCVIGDYVHIAPRAVLCGGVTIGEGTMIGAGATILPGIKIGAWAKVGAGSVVTKDVPGSATAVGHPARIIKTHG